MAGKNDAVVASSVSIDAQDLDLSALVGMEGSVLDAIVREVRAENDEDPQARHSSHSSYSSHSTRW